MPDKIEKFYSPPSILVRIAIPNTQKKNAIGHMGLVAKKYRLMLEFKEVRPDENYPDCTYYAIMVKPGYKIKSAEALVKASTDVQTFQGLLQAAVMSQNLPQKILRDNGLQ